MQIFHASHLNFFPAYKHIKIGKPLRQLNKKLHKTYGTFFKDQELSSSSCYYPTVNELYIQVIAEVP